MSHRPLAPRIVNRIGRRVHRNRTSEPFLSGDLFASKADLIVSRGFKTDRKLASLINSSRVIFCKGDQAQEFLELFGENLIDKILIIGNSDKDWLFFPIHLVPRIRAVFLQNSFVSCDRIFTLPIGIENLSHYKNGRVRNFDSKFLLNEKSDRVLVGPYSPTHTLRANIMMNLHNSSRIEIAKTPILNPYEYAEFSSMFGYIASPRGNGEDTHRIWESLYRGSSPVILENPWSMSLRELELPLSIVDQWSNQCLNELDPFRKFNPAALPTLWWPYWRRRINLLL